MKEFFIFFSRETRTTTATTQYQTREVTHKYCYHQQTMVVFYYPILILPIIVVLSNGAVASINHHGEKEEPFERIRRTKNERNNVCKTVDLRSNKQSEDDEHLRSSFFELICTGSTGGAKLVDSTGFIFRRSAPGAKMIQLDGGTQLHGLEIAAACGHFDDFIDNSSINTNDQDDQQTRKSTKLLSDFEKAQMVWQNIVGQTISHPHLDHISDFIMMSQELPFGGNFPVYARQTVLDDLQNHVFNNKIWPDFFDLGFSPTEKTLVKVPLKENEPALLEDIGIEITPFLLNHGNPGGSTSFLLCKPSSSSYSAAIRSGDACFLTIFDTGPDSVLDDKDKELQTVWEYVAPLYIKGLLKGILIESSFVTETKDEMLFGHLTPCYVLQELRVLANMAGVESLDGLNILIMHIKWKMLDTNYIEKVQNEFSMDVLDNGQGTCAEKNDLNVKFTFVQQGRRYLL
jgi:3',5'-cyclic-nucleotide phosphodiesterase